MKYERKDSIREASPKFFTKPKAVITSFSTLRDATAFNALKKGR